MKRLLVLLLAGLLAAPSVMAATWEIDAAHSYVGFVVKHLVISKVKGNFGAFSGSIDFDGKDYSKASVSVDIDVKSINTDNAKRDDHLRTGDFFAADSFPKMMFKSKKVIPGTGNNFKIVGDLTMRGKTKEITLDATFNGTIKGFRGDVASFSATGTINRQDWGVSWSRALDGGGLVVSDEVQLVFEIEAGLKQ